MQSPEREGPYSSWYSYMYYVFTCGVERTDVFGVLGRHFVSKAEILLCSKMNVKHDAYGPYRVVRTHATHRQTHTRRGFDKHESRRTGTDETNLENLWRTGQARE